MKNLPSRDYSKTISPVFKLPNGLANFKFR